MYIDSDVIGIIVVLIIIIGIPLLVGMIDDSDKDKRAFIHQGGFSDEFMRFYNANRHLGEHKALKKYLTNEKIKQIQYKIDEPERRAREKWDKEFEEWKRNNMNKGKFNS